MASGIDPNLQRMRELVSELGLSASATPEDFDTTAPMDKDLEAIYKSIVTDPPVAKNTQPVRRARTKPVLRWGSARLVTAAVTAVTVTAAIVGSHLMAEPASAESIPMLDFQYASGGQIAATAGVDPAAYFDQVIEAARATSIPIPINATTQHIVTDSLFARFNVNSQGDGSAITQASGVESWLAKDGSARRREVRPSGQLDLNGRLIPSDRQWSELQSVNDDIFPAGEIDPLFAAHLSLDPAVLKKQLFDFASFDPTSTTSIDQTATIMNAVTYLHGIYVISPELNAAMWEVLATMPGIRSLGSVIDRDGRSGVAFSYSPATGATYFQIVIISSDDGHLLGTEDVTSDPEIVGTGGPAVTSFTTYLSAEWTVPGLMPPPNRPLSSN